MQTFPEMEEEIRSNITPDRSFYWCPTCKEEIEPTYQERCEECGSHCECIDGSEDDSWCIAMLNEIDDLRGFNTFIFHVAGLFAMTAFAIGWVLGVIV